MPKPLIGAIFPTTHFGAKKVSKIGKYNIFPQTWQNNIGVDTVKAYLRKYRQSVHATLEFNLIIPIHLNVEAKYQSWVEFFQNGIFLK